MISFANVVVYNYQYLLDPKIAQLVSSSMQRECVVVFDEAHNIDNICIEVMSINFRLPTLDAAQRNLGKLRSDVDRLKATDARRLNDEYQRLVAGLQTQGAMPTNDGGCGFGCTTHELPANPVLPADILQQAVPGNLRRADSFVRFLARFVAHVRRRMSTDQLVVETPTAFLARLMGEEEIEAKPLKFVSDRLRSLLRTLEVTDVAEYAPRSRPASAPVSPPARCFAPLGSAIHSQDSKRPLRMQIGAPTRICGLGSSVCRTHRTHSSTLPASSARKRLRRSRHCPQPLPLSTAADAEA